MVFWSQNFCNASQVIKNSISWTVFGIFISFRSIKAYRETLFGKHEQVSAGLELGTQSVRGSLGSDFGWGSQRDTVWGVRQDPKWACFTHWKLTVNRFCLLAYTWKAKKSCQVSWLSFHHRVLLLRRDLRVSQPQAKEREKAAKSQVL